MQCCENSHLKSLYKIIALDKNSIVIQFEGRKIRYY